MSAFTEHTAYTSIPGGRFVLLQPLRWEVGRLGSGLVWTVPKGFEFDVSIPRWLCWLLSPLDRRFLLAAAVHDHMLVDGWARNRAAIEFYHALRAGGCGRVLTFIMTTAVLAWTTR